MFAAFMEVSMNISMPPTPMHRANTINAFSALSSTMPASLTKNHRATGVANGMTKSLDEYVIAIIAMCRPFITSLTDFYADEVFRHGFAHLAPPYEEEGYRYEPNDERYLDPVLEYLVQ